MPQRYEELHKYAKTNEEILLTSRFFILLFSMNTTFPPLFVFRFHKHFVSLQADSIAHQSRTVETMEEERNLHEVNGVETSHPHDEDEKQDGFSFNAASLPSFRGVP